MSVMQLFGALVMPGKEEGGNRAEAALVQRLRRSDPSAIGTAYDQHHAAVRAFARRLLGDDAAAEDLVHEVFVSLPSAVRRFEGKSSLRTFLISIAVNHARHHLRAATRNRAAMARFAQEPESTAEDPEHLAHRASLARALATALDALPMEQRVAFVLFEVDEYTSREAAEIMGIPEATVRTRVFHARQKLRALLEEQGIR
ncbi:RNA polymerase sigma factor [Chondromyces apiculatus]|uniref:RNA polymerase sigma factor n=1 Tax=Chondromyces apiculatus DSM 436 TaxID=1192034 RepID=A0A017SVD4_9BACT|nr:RNA polymerase sigma factor [Chondromyces apiculatus]EYF00727.1 RNA polymerase sigma factor [Chondromyces apiculatus DSM 436]